MKKYSLGVLIFLAFIAIGHYGGWWDGIIHPVRTLPAPTVAPVLPPGMVMRETKLIGWDEEKKAWEIEAKQIWQSSDGGTIHFEQIRRGVIYSVKQKEVRFKAGWVRWEKYTRRLFVGGGLEALIEKGTFTTAEAVMEYQTDLMFCNRPVKYIEPDLDMSALKMKIDFKAEELTLEGDVRLRQKDDEIHAEGVIYNQKDEKYRLVQPKGVTLSL